MGCAPSAARPCRCARSPPRRTPRCRSTTSVSSRRKKGLSSTTSTVALSERVDTMRHRAHLEGAVWPRPAARCDRNRRRPPPRRAGCRARSATWREATTLRSPIWIVPGGASAANMLAPPARRAVTLRRLAPRSAISSSSARHCAYAGTWPGFPSCLRQRRRGQEHVGQTADRGAPDRGARSRCSCPVPR